MSTRLRELIDRLHGQNIHPTGKELADVLWLALRMGELEAVRTTQEPADGKKAPSTTPIDQPVGPTPSLQLETGITTGAPVEEQRVPIYVEPSPPATPATEERPGVGARPFRAPAVPALPDSLALSRALRPLMRKVPSRSRRILDETATAERYADWRLWLPVFKGQPERWLELALVIDASPSLSLWRPTLTELYRLLARHGAFRDVRRWSLGVDAQGKPVLSKGFADTPRRPEELLHPEGRRLVIVVSDYAAPPWYTGAYDRWLRLWSRTQPLALLHLLPPRFWLRGGLQRTRLAQFHALAPGLPNPQLLPDVAVSVQPPHPNPPPQRGRELLQKREPVFLPVFTLEPESVALWARLLVGSGETRSPGVVLDRTVVSSPPASGQEMTVQERLRYFRSSASPEAQTLARYCAALPLTLAVMRLLQVEMLPHSRQVHLAEVFFSGLLLRRNPQEKDPEQFIYDFRPELREKLLDTLRAPLILDIHQRLSDAVRRNLGRIADFPAFIPDFLTEGGLRLDERSLPFAEVGVTVLRRLGGRYVERAERLAIEIEKLRVAAATLGRRQAEEKPVPAPTKPTPPIKPYFPCLVDKSLLVAVFVPTTDKTGKDFKGKRGELATGYLVGKDLILTVRHVLQSEPPYYRDKRYPVAIHWYYFGSDSELDWIEISEKSIIWQSQGELDAALIRCPRPPDALGWGIISYEKPRDGMRWQSVGFPRATKYADVRHPSSFGGQVRSMADQDAFFELIENAQPEKDEDWKGASGMPVFVGDRILGVVQSLPPKFNVRKLYATPAWRLLKDEAFCHVIGYDEQAARINKVKSRLVKLLADSPDVIETLIRQIGITDEMTGLPADRLTQQLSDYLLEMDFRTVIVALNRAHHSLFDKRDDKSGEQGTDAVATLVEIAQLVVPAIYDYGVVQWTRSQRDNGDAALVPLPAGTKTVAEIIMAGVDGRETWFRPCEHEYDQQKGQLCLSWIPTHGIDPYSRGARKAFQEYLHHKFIPERPALGLTREQLIMITNNYLEARSRDGGQTYYMVFPLPADAEERNALYILVQSLKNDYPAIMFLALTLPYEQVLEERHLIDPFCRMLPTKGTPK